MFHLVCFVYFFTVRAVESSGSPSSPKLVPEDFVL
nr:MAG TPA: hypothetical protein [Herelleviridae sp.]